MKSNKAVQINSLQLITLLIGITLFVFLLYLPKANAAGLGNYSNGYRMGQLTKFSVKGLFIKNGEGQMLVGPESTPYVITTTDSEGNKSRKTINPWYFSSSNNVMWSKLKANMGEYVVITYQQSHIKALTVDTDYEVIAINKISAPLTKT